MPRGDVSTYDWLEADAGDGRVLRGGAFYLLMMEPRGLTQAAGACCEAGGFIAAGDSAGCDWPPAGAGLEVGGFDAAGDGAAFGWLAGGLTQSAGRALRRAGRSGNFRGLALASLPLLEQSGRSGWTGSRGPMQETGEGAWPWHLAH